MLSPEFTDNGTLFDFSIGERPADAE